MKLNGEDFEVQNIKGYSTEVLKLTGYIKQLHQEEEKVSNINFNQNSINQASEEVKQVSNEINNSLDNVEVSGLKEKISSVVEAIKQKLQGLKNIDIGINTNKSSAELDLLNYKISEIEEELEKAKNGEIHLSVKGGLEAEAQLEKLNAQKEKLESGGNSGGFFTKITSAIKSAGSSLKSATKLTSSWKNGLNQVNKVSTNVVTKIKSMGSGMKSGLKQVIKYAGALFSLRSIYSTLSSSASSWLSSQNAQAQQLSANIDYMKYAMRKCICSSDRICN